jgi:aminopeptidase N
VESPNNITLDEARIRSSVISDAAYRVHLDLTKADRFRSESVVRFRCSDPSTETHIDLTAPSVESMELNGVALPPEAFDGNRIRLRGLAAENELRIVARCAYHGAEIGMHRFVDPEDGEVYLHTHLEPFNAHRVFACFDQPDIKATIDTTVTASASWEVVANTPVDGEPIPGDGDTATWTFVTTPRLSTYLFVVVAGGYHVIRDQYRDIPLGLYCRRSLATYMEADAPEILEVTKQGLDFFEPAFGTPYAFGKYDQAFIPESNSGAMENAGCVTFNEAYIFRSRVTDAGHERRADTILHEMAHMWFGDLVTMRWFADLWLNESFASYMAVLCQVAATRWKEGWTTFAITEKGWAYRQDQLPSTHPIVADVPDAESIHLNFDGITYAKGASVLRQLEAWVGLDAFLEGVRAYMEKHAYGNASLDDFLGALEETSGRDLHSWSKEWLESAGVNTLRSEQSLSGGGAFESFAILQDSPADWPTLRSHRLAVGLYDDDPTTGKLVRRKRIELDVVGMRTEVPELAGEAVPALTLINDDDLTYAKIRLDPRSLSTVVERLRDIADSLPRAICWTACWDMTRDAEMTTRDYVRLVLGNAEAEDRVGIVQTTLMQAAMAIHTYGDPSNRGALSASLAAESLQALRRTEAGSDHQLAWARMFVAAARTPEELALVRGLLDGTESFDGLVIDPDLRWHIVRSLAAAGEADEAVIEAERANDPTDRGERQAGAALASRPTPEAKEAAWREIVSGQTPLAVIEDVMVGFQQLDQDELLTPFAERFFDELANVWATRDLQESIAFGRYMYPHRIIAQETIDRTERYLASPEVPGPIRRLLEEGKDGIARALRARAADAAAATA